MSGRSKLKRYRVDQITTPGQEIPFQLFWNQGMRQLPATGISTLLVNGYQPLCTVPLRANEWAENKMCIVQAHYVLSLQIGTFLAGVTIADAVEFDSNGFIDVTPQAVPAIGTVVVPTSLSYWATFFLYRNQTTLFCGMENWVGYQGPSNTIVPQGTIVPVPIAAPHEDWSLPHTLTFGINCVGGPGLNIALCSYVRALIESPVNIGRLP